MESNQSESKENLTTTTSVFSSDPPYPPSSPPPGPPPQYSATNHAASDTEAPSMPHPQPYPPPANGYPQPYPSPPNGYPQPYPPPPTAPPYYTPPGMANAGQPRAGPYYGPPVTPQQQRQQVVVVSNPTTPIPIVVPRAHVQTVSLARALVLSCLVTWLFGWLCGGIAYILAVSGQSAAAAGDTKGAIRLRNASYAFSAIGILLGTAAIVVIAVFSSGSVYYRYNSYYSANNGYNSYYSGYNGYYSTIGYYTQPRYKTCISYYYSNYIYYYACLQ